MQKNILVLLLAIFFCGQGFAQKISGVVQDTAGNRLPFATIEVKGKNISTTANASGQFSITLSPGSYILSCQHIGYERQQIAVELLANEKKEVNFNLKLQQLTLAEVVVKKGEDPAYEIIRQAIKKRPQYKNDPESYSCEVYTKGQLRLRDFPKKFMGQKVDFEDGDTGKNKILFFSETVSRFSVQKPNKSKIEVLASKVSGQSNGYGLSAPRVISFYENTIEIGQNLSPRGFVSPIADNALSFYRYKYEGAFFEDGKQISRIQVIPKRKFEPVFSGYIHIVEDEWRIHSLQLLLTKSAGMEMLDTLRLEQLYMPVSNGAWVVKSQVMYPAIKMFGFDAHGSFLNIYSAYDLQPVFPRNYFNSTILKYTDSATKKTSDYWNETRPLVLQQDEAEDYRKKDSIEKLRQSPAYLDSLDRARNKVTVSGLLLNGLSFSDQKTRTNFSLSPLTQMLSYNTVEGMVINFRGVYFKRLDTIPNSRHRISISPELRYGFSNQHFNANLSASYFFGKKHYNFVSVSGGSDVFQFNNAAPVGILGSTVSALLSRRNNLKIYEAVFGNLSFSKGLGKGLNLQVGAQYQDRRPLENSSDFSFSKTDKRTFTPNYPLPQFDQNILRHQAFVANIGLRWQPGSRYMEFPEQTISLGSKAPTFIFNYQHALPGVMGSDVEYSKWLLNISDAVGLKMLGDLQYRADVGGFINTTKVEVPDYTHYKGNMSARLSGSYLNRFQLIPHYYLSNTSDFYSLLYAEHHFNGFITNKIPLLKQLKWNLVTGTNALYLSPDKQYAEVFVGLENIFKMIRVDYNWGFEKDGPSLRGFRLGIKSSFLNID